MIRMAGSDRPESRATAGGAGPPRRNQIRKLRYEWGMKRPSSEELMAGIRLGESEAFDALFSRHRRHAFDYAVRVLLDARDAEDVVQEAFLRIYLAACRGGFDPAKGRFITYLFRVLRNLCYDRMGRRSKTPLNVSDLAAPGASADEGEGQRDYDDGLTDRVTPAETFDRRQLRRRLRAALARLPALQREALTLRGYDGMSYREIAKVIDRPVSHVKVILFRARQALAEIVGADVTGSAASPAEPPRSAARVETVEEKRS